MIRAIGATALVAVLAAPLAVPASAQHGHDYRGGHYDRGHDGGGIGVAGGALLGLGVGAVIGGAIASAAPPAYYPPPPVYYPPPTPAYYPPPPVYYGY